MLKDLTNKNTYLNKSYLIILKHSFSYFIWNEALKRPQKGLRSPEHVKRWTAMINQKFRSIKMRDIKVLKGDKTKQKVQWFSKMGLLSSVKTS